MGKLKLYIATSLDNFIARPNGDIDWLDKVPPPSDSDYGYGAFYSAIDITVMGMNTYRQILGFNVPFPYPDKINYVLTRQTNPPEDNHVSFVSENAAAFMRTLKAESGRDIWLIGGTQVNTLMLEQGLIDEMIIARLPIVIGRGLPLFSENGTEQRFGLLGCRTFDNGVVQLHYANRPGGDDDSKQ